LLAEELDPLAQGGEAGAKGGEERSFHKAQYYYCA